LVDKNEAIIVRRIDKLLYLEIHADRCPPTCAYQNIPAC